MRAITGRVPDHRVLAADAARGGRREPGVAGAGRSRPRDRRSRARPRVAEAAARLARSGGGQGPRALPARPERRAAALGHQPLGARPDRLVDERWPDPGHAGDRGRRSRRTGWRSAPYSLSALQRFATCPYQFLLATIHRLEPWDEPEPLVRMDPLTRGSLFHAVQAEFYRALEAERRAAGHARARCRRPSRRSTTCSTASPPSTRRSSRPRSSASGATRSTSCGATSASGCRSSRTTRDWVPTYFEFSFGLNDEGRDPRSLPEPVARRRPLRAARIGRSHRAARGSSTCCGSPITRPARTGRIPILIVGGGDGAAAGAVQRGDRAGARQAGRRGAPVLLHDRRRVRASTRSRSTTTRAGRGSQVLTIVDRAVEQGFLRRGARRARVHAGATSGRSAVRARRSASKRKADRSARRPRRAEERCDDAPVVGLRAEPTIAGDAGAPSPKTSTTRSSSKRPPAPARRPSSSSASSRVLATGRATMIEIVAVTFTEKAAGELKLRLREALENERASADDAVVRARLDAGARDARGGARQHDPRLLRRPAARAAGRGARRSAVRGADRAAGGPAVRARVPRLAAGGARRIRRRACGARCGARAAPSFGGGDGDGPIDRLRSAGRALAEWRDFPAPWRRPPFDRDAEIDRLVAALHRLAELTAAPASRRATTCSSTPTRVRRLSRQIRLEQSFGQRDLRRLGGAARRSRARPRVLADAQGQRLQVRKGRHAHRGARRARRAVRRAAAVQARTRMPTSPRACSRSWRARPARYQELKAAAGALDFADLLVRARDLIASDADVRRHLQREVRAHLRRRVPGHRSGPGRDPAAARRRRPGDDRLRPASRPSPGKLFIVGDPKQAIYRFRGTDVGDLLARQPRQLEALRRPACCS